MKFTRILNYDFKNGFIKSAWKQILCIGLVSVSCISFFLKLSDYTRFYEIGSWKELSISSSDVALYCFGGMLRFVPENATAFHLPILWIMMTSGICYLTLQYPYRDISQMGIQIIIRSGGKVSWWLSKCLWSTTTVVSSFVIIHVMIIIICNIAGIPVSLSVNTLVCQGIYGLTAFNEPDGKSVVWFIYILPMLVCGGISILQMLLSLVFKPFVAFVCVSVLFISNVYFYSPYLIGNYAMPLRANIFGNGSLRYSTGLILCLVLYVLYIGIGAIVIKNKELLSVEK